MKKSKYLNLILLLVFTFTIVGTVFANSMYRKLNNWDVVYIEEVIEGNSFLVSKDNNEYLVKLVGIDTEGYTETIETLEAFLLSKPVVFNTVQTKNTPNDRWNYGTLRYSNKDLGSFILESGLGKFDESNLNNPDLLYLYDKNENYAFNRGFNIWEDEYSDFKVVLNVININTASTIYMTKHLGISSKLAKAIQDYRKYNPINTPLELKFVNGMTSEVFHSFVDKVVVATNVNTASLLELQSLYGISESDAREIELERNKGYLSRTDFKDFKFVSTSDYEKNSDFIYFDGHKDTISTVYPKGIVVNTNTATSKQLREAGISSSNSSKLEKYSSQIPYVFHNFEELKDMGSLSNSFDNYNRYKYTDNISFVTNINRASESEIRSLYGEYEDEYETSINKLLKQRPFYSFSEISSLLPFESHSKLKDIIVFEDDQSNYININTASKGTLRELGFSTSEVDYIVKKRPFKTYDKLSDDLHEYASEITLVTNINEASREELKTLNSRFTGTLLDTFITYRDREYFGSLDEVEDFFTDLDEEELFEDIEDFITVK